MRATDLLIFPQFFLRGTLWDPTCAQLITFILWFMWIEDDQVLGQNKIGIRQFQIVFGRVGKFFEKRTDVIPSKYPNQPAAKRGRPGR